MACVQVLAHCGGPLVSSVKFGTLGRSFGAAIASLCNSPFEAPQQGKRKMTSDDNQKSTELTYFSMPDHSQSVRNLNTIAEDEVVADVDLEQEWRQQMVQNGREIVDLTRICRQRKELLDFQKGLLEERDREIQDWVTKVEHLQAQRDQGAGVASGKPVMTVDEQLEAEWQKFVLDEKDDEIKKLRAEVEKLKAEKTKAGQSSEEVESFLLRQTELRAENTVLGAELERVRAELVKAKDLFDPLMHSPIAGA